MRKLLAIKVQSITDLITNSSSELFLQTDTISTTGICGYTISDLLDDIKDNVSGDISLEYFVTADE